MIRDRGLITFQCDGCLTELDTDTDDWNVAMSHFRGESWRSVKRDGEWEHLCDGCAYDRDQRS